MLVGVNRFAILAVKHDAGDGVMFSVAQRNEGRSDTALRRKFLRRTRKDEKWLAAWFFSNVDVAPAHGLANASAECFGDSFFCGKTRSQMSRREFHRHRILNLTIGKDAVQKTIAKPIHGPLNSRAFHKIDADSKHVHPG